MVFEAVLSSEAQAVVSTAIAGLETAPRRFATRKEAREALDAAIAAELSGPFVTLLCVTEANALGDAIMKHLSYGKKTIVGRTWLEAQRRLLGGVPAAMADSQRLLDEMLRRRDAAQQPPAMLAGSVTAQGLATQPQLPSESPPAVGAPPVPRPAAPSDDDDAPPDALPDDDIVVFNLSEDEHDDDDGRDDHGRDDDGRDGEQRDDHPAAAHARD